MDYGTATDPDTWYDNIAHFNGGNTLTINAGGNDIGFGTALSFKIYSDASLTEVLRDTILHVDLSGTDRIVFGQFVDESWTVQTGGSFTTAAGLTFQIGENAAPSSSNPGLNGTLTALAGSTTMFGGSLVLGGRGSNGGDGSLTGGGEMTFKSAVSIGGTGGLGILRSAGDGGDGSLTGGGEMTFESTVSIGGTGGEGFLSNRGDGGDGTITVSAMGSTLRFGGDVTLGGQGGGTLGALGTGTVEISDGTVIMSGGNTMIANGDAGKFTLSGGTFQSGIKAGTGVTVESRTFDIGNAATLAFDMTGATATTTNLTLTGAAFSSREAPFRAASTTGPSAASTNREIFRWTDS